MKDEYIKEIDTLHVYGICLQGDTTVFEVRNIENHFAYSDSVFISDGIALKQRPTNVEMLRKELLPAQELRVLMDCFCTGF